MFTMDNIDDYIPYSTGITNLFIGGILCCHDIKKHGISAVLSIEDIDITNKQVGVTYCFHKLRDDDKTTLSLLIKPTTEWIHQRLNENKKVLVRCKDGRNRSASIICAYMIKYFNHPLDKAFKILQQNKSNVKLHIGLYQQLQVYSTNKFKHLCNPKYKYGIAPYKIINFIYHILGCNFGILSEVIEYL